MSRDEFADAFQSAAGPIVALIATIVYYLLKPVALAATFGLVALLAISGQRQSRHGRGEP